MNDQLVILFLETDQALVGVDHLFEVDGFVGDDRERVAMKVILVDLPDLPRVKSPRQGTKLMGLATDG